MGGAERQALKLAQQFIKKGVQVTIVTGLWDWGQPLMHSSRQRAC